ncbi:GNAT family N-acetyltransferase [Gymnodinialimonas hymeniacidonis]|uniref:GNAT family N-acetyltransferase n=1 Tax=Gymnodinialimonas hymeniacidonis TaxID=3126508 RepID=UPI0034C6AB08
MRVGPADPSDPQVAVLIQTHHETGRLHYDEADCHSLDTDAVAEIGVAMYAAWLDGQVVAIGGLKALGQGAVELKAMHTSEAARGKGVASALLAHLMEAARTAGHHTMFLEAGRSDDYAAPARALYRRHGFTECAPFGDYVARDASIFMSCNL